MTKLRLFRRTKKKTASQRPEGFVFNRGQHRLLSILVILALLVGCWLVKSYFTTVLFAIVSAYLAYPIYRWFGTKLQSPGLALSLTLLSATLVLIVPLALILTVTVYEINQLLHQLSSSTGKLSVTEFGTDALGTVNSLLNSITNGAYQITVEQVRNSLENIISHMASAVLDLLSSSVSSIGKLVTNLVLYFYIFSAVLSHHDVLLRKIRQLNPLSNRVADLYLERLGAMTKGIVGGQFVIAIAQGVVSAAVLYIAGLHYFALFAMILTLASIIPLGAGIITIPIGVIMILLGNVWQGVMIIANHLIVVTNIDNVLRPYLIPQSGKLNPALTMLAVFSGVAIFGFPGILIGPLIMIFVITTLDVYLSLESAQTTDEQPSRQT